MDGGDLGFFCYQLCAASASPLAAKRVTTSALIEEREINSLSGLLISVEKWTNGLEIICGKNIGFKKIYPRIAIRS